MGLDVVMIGGAQLQQEGREDPDFAVLVNYIVHNFPAETDKQVGQLVDPVTEGHQVGAYSDLHILRGLAIALATDGPGLVARMSETDFDRAADAFFERQLPATRFKHLLDHQDDRGYYVPFDLADPLVIQGNLKGQEEPIFVSVGSSRALQRELDELNAVLGMPGDAGELTPPILEKATTDHRWPRCARVWAVLHLYARVSSERYLFIRFC